MKKRTLFALHIAACFMPCEIPACFRGYYEIGGVANPMPPPASLSTFVIPAGSAMQLDGGSGDTWYPFWSFSASGQGQAEFHRFPGLQGVNASGFLLRASRPNSTASFTIPAPPDPVPEDGFYEVRWSARLNPGDLAIVKDLDGEHVLASSAGLSSGITVISLGPSLLPDFGFVLQTSAEAGFAADSDLCIHSLEPTIPTLAHAGGASAITSTSAQMVGTIRPEGQPVTAWFEWGTNEIATCTSTVFSVSADVVATQLVHNAAQLLPDTRYHCRLVASYGGGYQTSSWVMFTTLLGDLAEPKAVFDGYFSIGGGPGGASSFCLQGGSSLSLYDGVGDTEPPFWELSCIGTWGGLIEFTRFQAAQDRKADAFMLSVDRDCVASFVIEPPVSGVSTCNSAYAFLWTSTLPPGASVWVSDARGYRLLANTPGYYCEYASFLVEPNRPENVGFFVEGSPDQVTEVFFRGLTRLSPRLEIGPGLQMGPVTGQLTAAAAPLGWALTAWFEWGEGALTNRTPAHTLDCVADSRTLAETITGLRPGTTYQFRLVTTNQELGRVFASEVRTLITGQPPAISTQPHGWTNLAGTTATFCVSATGMPSPNYQWRFNGSIITNATDSCLTITNVQAANAGSYDVLVANVAGSVTSAVAWLAVPGFELSNSVTITIYDHAPASPYPSIIGVTGKVGTVRQVVARLHGLSHSWPEDVGVLLVGPQGQKVVLMARAGGGQAVQNLQLIFTDSASGMLADEGPLASGTYRPGSFAPNHAFPAPAPPGGYATNLSVFNGANPNGFWALYVSDDGVGDSGSVNNGWSLALVLGVPPAIQAQPSDQMVIAGHTAVFEVVASGIAPLDYTWQHGGVDVMDGGRVTGAATARLTIANVEPGDEGNYSVRVSNAGGEVESSPARLTVLPACTPALCCLERLPNGSIQFELAGVVGATYVVEATANLGTWRPFQTLVLTDNPAFVVDNSVGLQQRYYRAWTQPCAAGSQGAEGTIETQ
jgi:hypothetical protein